jgi:hypothetical protein
MLTYADVCRRVLTYAEIAVMRAQILREETGGMSRSGGGGEAGQAEGGGTEAGWEEGRESEEEEVVTRALKGRFAGLSVILFSPSLFPLVLFARSPPKKQARW